MPDFKRIKSAMEVAGPLGSDRLDEPFLNSIREIESSKGVNLDHIPMESGIHKGQAAIGEFGLMPNTIRELAARLRRRDPKLQLDPSFQGDPEIQQWEVPSEENATTDAKLSAAFADSPDLQRRTARYMGRLLESRADGNLEKMAYGYNMGHNKKLSELPIETITSNPYVSKFKALQEYMLNRKSQK